MKIRYFLVSLLIMAPALAHASDEQAITVFGLPLGGKPQLSNCMALVLDKATYDYCILYDAKGRYDNGAKVLGLGNKKLIPSWADHYEFLGSFSDDGRLFSLELRGKQYGGIGRIVDSISQRFGRPDTLSERPRSEHATWNTQGIRISINCFGDPLDCRISFLSPAQTALFNSKPQVIVAPRPATP